MRFVIYGLPCSGKTYQMNRINNLEKINGSELLNKLSNNKFEELTVLEKEQKRKELLDVIKEKDNFIIDGHFMFPSPRWPSLTPANIVFTENDALFYDVYLYLYEDSQIIKSRIEHSNKNKHYLDGNIDIKKWQEIEIKKLKESCRKNNKDFYIIDNPTYLPEFIEEIRNGYSNVNKARKIVDEILKDSFTLEINLVDGDRTIVKEDTSKTILNYKTHTFDNNFFTGYQFFLQKKEMEQYKDINIPDKLTLNKVLLEKIKDRYNCLLSSGNPLIWNKLGKKLNFNKIYAGYEISEETKYFVCKFFKKERIVNAYGDSKIDIPMIKESNNGYLILFDKLSRSLEGVDIKGIKTLFCEPYILENKTDINELVKKTKSDSGICGNELANTHFKLGQMLGDVLKTVTNEEKTTIVSILRGGLFLSNGIYSKVNGHIQLYNDKLESDFKIENSLDDTVILVDSVINSGDTILKLINKIKENNNIKNIIIVACVIQEEALKKIDKYQVLTVRTSKNKFVGAKVSKQIGDKGPDTSDRLFNTL